MKAYSAYSIKLRKKSILVPLKSYKLLLIYICILKCYSCSACYCSFYQWFHFDKMQDYILPRKENNSNLSNIWEKYSFKERAFHCLSLISDRDNIKTRNNLGQPRKVAMHDRRAQKCLLESINVVSTRARSRLKITIKSVYRTRKIKSDTRSNRYLVKSAGLYTLELYVNLSVIAAFKYRRRWHPTT